jgi:hypothetical protein
MPQPTVLGGGGEDAVFFGHYYFCVVSPQNLPEG